MEYKAINENNNIYIVLGIIISVSVVILDDIYTQGILFEAVKIMTWGILSTDRNKKI